MASGISLHKYHFISEQRLKDFLAAEDKNPPYTLDEKSSNLGWGILLSSSCNKPSQAAQRELSSGISVSSNLKKLISGEFQNKIKNIQLYEEGYCHGATVLFIRECLKNTQNGAVDLNAIAKKFHDGVPVKGVIFQLFPTFNYLDREESIYPYDLTIKWTKIEDCQEKKEIIQTLKQLPVGFYYFTIHVNGYEGEHAVALIKQCIAERAAFSIFDINHGLIAFEGLDPEMNIYLYLIDSCKKLFTPDKTNELEGKFTLSLQQSKSQVLNLKKQLEDQGVLLVRQEIQKSHNVTFNGMVAFTYFKKLNMYAMPYLKKLIFMSVLSLAAETLKIIPYVSSFSRWVIVPLTCGAFSSLGDLKPIFNEDRIVSGLSYLSKSGQEEGLSYLPGIAMSLAYEMFIPSSNFLAKAGITTAAMITSFAAGVIVDRLDLPKKALDGLSYIKEKINAASAARKVMSITANFFRSLCYAD